VVHLVFQRGEERLGGGMSPHISVRPRLVQTRLAAQKVLKTVDVYCPAVAVKNSAGLTCVDALA
jgi:hypothetical protein